MSLPPAKRSFMPEQGAASNGYTVSGLGFAPPVSEVGDDNNCFLSVWVQYVRSDYLTCLPPKSQEELDVLALKAQNRQLVLKGRQRDEVCACVRVCVCVCV